MGANSLLRPGTLFVMVLAVGVGFAVFGWTGDILEDTEKGPAEQSSRAVECSKLDVDFIGEDRNSTHQTIYVQADQDVQTMAVIFYGEEKNITRLVDYGPATSVSEISASVPDAEDIEVQVQGCSRTFWR